MPQATTSKASKQDTASTHPVSDKIKDSLHESVDSLAEKASATEASLRKNAAKGSQDFTAKQRELESQWEQSDIKRYAVENPVATAGIAFAAGMLVSALLRRK